MSGLMVNYGAETEDAGLIEFLTKLADRVDSLDDVVQAVREFANSEANRFQKLSRADYLLALHGIVGALTTAFGNLDWRIGRKEWADVMKLDCFVSGNDPVHVGEVSQRLIDRTGARLYDSLADMAGVPNENLGIPRPTSLRITAMGQKLYFHPSFLYSDFADRETSLKKSHEAVEAQLLDGYNALSRLGEAVNCLSVRERAELARLVTEALNELDKLIGSRIAQEDK